MAEKNNGLKVVIVGGSIAGLTLAHCLQKGGVDFVVLEAHKEIAPQVGASIGVLPNGARVLDQLGMWDDIKDMVMPLRTAETWTRDGVPICKNDYSALLEARFGYAVAFLDRQLVLKVLANHMTDQSKIQTGKKVVRVEHSNEKGVLVHCEDGSRYVGDIVAGADGVHSTIRHEMWRHADSSGQDLSNDKTALSAEYKCLFGISTAVPGLVPGTSHRGYNDGYSTLVIIGKAGRCFWFVIEKLEKRCHAPNIPRYRKADEEQFVNASLHRYVAGGTPFSELWKRRETSALAALEEAQYDNWFIDRFAMTGDSIHKMTPNMGQGGNCAMESSAALANHIIELQRAHPTTKATLSEIRTALKKYQDGRQFRTAHICDAANNLTRLEAMATKKHEIYAKYIVPNFGDYLADVSSDAIVGAVSLNCVPLPAKSMNGNMPFNPASGVGQKESKLLRAVYALPLLCAGIYGHHVLSSTLSRTAPFMIEALKSGFIPSAGGAVSLRSSFYGLSLIDKTLERLVTIFTPSITGSDPAQRLQVIAFLADVVPMHIIWSIEALRRGNLLTTSMLSTLFACIYQRKGAGIVAPFYYFLHYIQSPQEKYEPSDNRMVPISDAKTILPAVALGYVLPGLLMFSPFSVGTKQLFCGIWQTFPLWTSVLRRAFKTVVEDTTVEDRKWAPTSDMPYLRYTYIFGGAISAAAYAYVYLSSPYSMRELFFGGVLSPLAPVTSLAGGIGRFMKYDQLLAFGSGLFWELLHFKDLKKAGRCDAPWWKIIGILSGSTLVAGPGAAMAVGWAWREECLAARTKFVETNGVEKS